MTDRIIEMLEEIICLLELADTDAAKANIEEAIYQIRLAQDLNQAAIAAFYD